MAHDVADRSCLRARMRAIAGDGAGLGRDVVGLGPVLDAALPWGGLPVAALHEVGGAAATSVAAGLARRFLAREGVLVWCTDDRLAATLGALHGPGLGRFGIAPARLLVVRGRDPAEALWAAAAALRSSAVACTVLELERLDLLTSRRLQLAAEAGGGAGILLRPGPVDTAPHAALTRFRAEPCPHDPATGAVRLALWRAKGGAPAAWRVIWNDATLAFDLAPGLGDRADGGDGAPPRRALSA